jgi:hypothetical protein
MTKDELKQRIKEIEVKNAFWKSSKDGSYEMALDRSGYYELCDKLKELDIPVKTPEQLVAEIRNKTIEEVALEFDKMKSGGDTTASFSIFIRNMKT